jgi:hypothetical protein
LDPQEYLDDYDEVTKDELAYFRTLRETTPWKKATPPPHSVVTGTKTHIGTDERTGKYDTRRRNPFAKVDLETAENFLADPAQMEVIPPREDEPHYYEVS